MSKQWKSGGGGWRREDGRWEFAVHVKHTPKRSITYEALAVKKGAQEYEVWIKGFFNPEAARDEIDRVVAAINSRVTVTEVVE